MYTILQMEPWFDEKEARAVFDYMDSGGWVTEFSRTREFEESVKRYVGSRYSAAVPNGALGLTLALAISGVGYGDEVLVPDFTMVATANAAKMLGARVTFIDIDPKTLCMDFELMKKAVSSKTKAVILVTINGRYPEEIESFVLFCRERNILLLEDAAQSLGSFKDGKHLGTFGDIGLFSFSAPKIITTGQGGILVTDNEEIYEKIKKYRDFGKEKPGEDHYITMGSNFKFTDIQAVIGLEQMKKLPWRVERKKQIFSLYEGNLKNVQEISFLPTNLKNTSPWFIDVMISGGMKEPLRKHLKERGIETRLFFPALHSEPAYARVNETYPVAEKVAVDGLWLPSSSKLTDKEIKYICKEITDFFVR
ncbi:aminotransferase [Candidatus Jorgensenbacteria bacterium RIFCSPHIGHO2_02_FULL_45_20]|uniref:Aminotransferase n=1 Tax=Candidatus Jorgensenbacteria bacterium RIFCSPHIGHO2_02_FULL_45_20 TaxID=1798470 RepID=A0A1F6BNM0_9BACT|nr:MAG: aminotransferase [Candidatus Jorgensenbacteria bacterium RIFCSPHIGHO2_02_FULL_45_20]